MRHLLLYFILYTKKKNFFSTENNKIVTSKSEARRVLANKGFKIDDVVIRDEKKIIQQNDFKKNILKLSYGKKRHFIVKIIYLYRSHSQIDSSF